MKKLLLLTTLTASLFASEVCDKSLQNAIKFRKMALDESNSSITQVTAAAQSTMELQFYKACIGSRKVKWSLEG